MAETTESQSQVMSIDPILLHAPFVPTNVEGQRIPQKVFEDHLQKCKRREPLVNSCIAFGIRHAKRDNLNCLRSALVQHWYTPLQGTPIDATTTTGAPGGPLGIDENSVATNTHVIPNDIDLNIDDATLVEEFDTTQGHGLSVFGAFDVGGLEDQDEDEELEEDNEHDLMDNRGLKTQKSVINSWNIFLSDTREKQQIRDEIVDEHSLLLFIDFSAQRCKRDRKGNSITGTRIGASQIKKEFFGALRIRKVQEARNPRLKMTRPAATVYVYDAVKTRMDEAVKNAQEGLIGDEDAPDIVANTFLDQLSDETLLKIRYGFLDHRELKATINGHLAWTMMNASGNRGDDIRALRLCEMQPYTLLHPNLETNIPCVLGLQSAHKAQNRGMKTTVNPTYTCFIAHRDPEMCPLGSFALYLHYIHDYAKLDEKYEIDYGTNKSWRAIRLIHGSSAIVPYHETALQNLFIQSYKKAGVQSRLKAHLARHMLGYQQIKMGVAAAETSKLGWSRDIYSDTYAPALPKTAILAAHGYKQHEDYHPPWRQIEVPPTFLELICPMAESHLETVSGKLNLLGATRYWEMVISLRPYVFQVAAALYQSRPGSSLFRLPALLREDVRTWMSTVFPSQLAMLKANAGSSVDLARIQNELLRQALEEVRAQSNLQQQQLRIQSEQLKLLNSKFDRRTGQWTPTKAPVFQAPSTATTQLIARSLMFEPDSSMSTTLPLCSQSSLAPSAVIDDETRASEDGGVYMNEDNLLRAFVAPSPQAPNSPRTRTPIDLVLPPMVSFCEPGSDLLPLHDPLFGKHSVQWPTVFSKIKQPGYIWDTWKPSKNLDQMSVKMVWDCYNTGENVVAADGQISGVKPPPRLVEQSFQSAWRKGSTARKAWQRFREIPEWIDQQIKQHGLSPTAAIDELEAMREVPGKATKLGTSALSLLVASKRKEIMRQALGSSMDVQSNVDLNLPPSLSHTNEAEASLALSSSAACYERSTRTVSFLPN